MKRFTLLFAAFLGTFVYVLLSRTGGRDGIWASHQLYKQKMELSVHAAEIQTINDELVLEYTALQKDPDVIAAYAKKLGFVGPNEHLVKITGLQAAPVSLYNTGVVLKREKIYSLSESVCKAAGTVVFLLVVIISALLHYSEELAQNKKEHTVIKGIPLYDLPQV